MEPGPPGLAAGKRPAKTSGPEDPTLPGNPIFHQPPVATLLAAFLSHPFTGTHEAGGRRACKAGPEAQPAGTLIRAVLLGPIALRLKTRALSGDPARLSFINDEK